MVDLVNLTPRMFTANAHNLVPFLSGAVLALRSGFGLFGMLRKCTTQIQQVADGCHVSTINRLQTVIAPTAFNPQRGRAGSPLPISPYSLS